MPKRGLYYEVSVEGQTVFTGQSARPDDYHEIRPGPQGAVYCVNPLDDPTISADIRKQLLAQLEQPISLPNLPHARVLVYATEFDTDFKNLPPPIYEFVYDGTPRS